MMDYNWDMEKDVVSNFCFDREELQQWIQRTLLTERNTFPQYTSNYGVEFEHLKGMPATYHPYILSNTYTTIKEALRVRREILDVTDFQTNILEENPDAIEITFQVHTIYGNFTQEYLLEKML